MRAMVTSQCAAGCTKWLFCSLWVRGIETGSWNGHEYKYKLAPLAADSILGNTPEDRLGTLRARYPFVQCRISIEYQTAVNMFMM